MTRRERAVLGELMWRRIQFDPPGPEPSDPDLREAWRTEGKLRGALNFLGVAKTVDEHAVEGAAAVQPFPICAACAKDAAANEEVRVTGVAPMQVARCVAHGKRHKPYFRVLMAEWLDTEILNFEKLSRQILGSWWAVGAHLWLALTRPGSLVGFQSSNLPKARELLNRAEVMYKTLPAELQRFGPMSDAPKAPARKVEDEMAFKHVEPDGRPATSRIITLPCGPAAVRMFTFTAIFIDECQHWDVDTDFEDSYGAAIACAKGGGRLTTVSSVGRPEAYHHRLCAGLVE